MDHQAVHSMTMVEMAEDITEAINNHNVALLTNISSFSLVMMVVVVVDDLEVVEGVLVEGKTRAILCSVAFFRSTLADADPPLDTMILHHNFQRW